MSVGFYPNVEKHRHAANISVNKLAREADIDRASLSRMIIGKMPVRDVTVRSVINILNARYNLGLEFDQEFVQVDR